MDILAAMLAYLTAVIGIVGALAVSFFVVFAAPGATVAPAQTVAAVAKASAPVPHRFDQIGAIQASRAPLPDAPARASHRRGAPPAVAANSFASRDIGIGARQKAPLAPEQLRHLEQEERAKRVAYQQGTDFETRFLSYAD